MVEYLKTLWLVDTKQNMLMAYKTEDMSLINSYDFPVLPDILGKCHITVTSDGKSVYILSCNLHKIFKFDIASEKFTKTIRVADGASYISEGYPTCDSNTGVYSTPFFVSNTEDNTISIIHDDQIRYEARISNQSGPGKSIIDSDGTGYVCGTLPDGHGNEIAILNSFSCKYTNYKNIYTDSVKPVDVIVDNHRNLYILREDGSLFKVHYSTASLEIAYCSNPIKLVEKALTLSKEMAFDNQDHIWIIGSDEEGNNLAKVDVKSGDLQKFKLPIDVLNAITCDDSGRIFVLAGNTVYSVTKDGVPTPHIIGEELNCSGDMTGYRFAVVNKKQEDIDSKLDSIIQFVDSYEALTALPSPSENKLYITKKCVYRYVENKFVPLITKEG